MLELIEAQDTDAILFYVAIRVGIILICWSFMTAANLIDFWSGISTAKALGEKLESHGFRRTVTKIGDYARFMMCAFMFDALGCFLSFYILPFATALSTVAVIAIEGRSVIENSRRKKAHVADVPDIIKDIVKAATTKQGTEVLEKIINEIIKTK